MTNNTFLAFRAPCQLAERANEAAAKNGISFSEFTRRAITAFLEAQR